MADDKTKSDKRDITQVAADEVVEVDYFAKRHGITPDLVRELIRSTATTAPSSKRRPPRSPAAGRPSLDRNPSFPLLATPAASRGGARPGP